MDSTNPKEENDHLDQMGSRKQSHLNLAFDAQNGLTDPRFYYEPLLSAHPGAGKTWPVKLGLKKQDYPLWVSSMTGGTSQAGEINIRLAKTAKKFGLGIGLGSCRIALESNSLLPGFNLRPHLGDDLPFYVNFGIAQAENMLEKGEASKMSGLVKKLNADGIIIHVNPLQEWLQPEGDRIKNAPLETLKKLLHEIPSSFIVKEVGQGFGIESMRQLLKLPLTAIEFAANGGTNFSKLELMRNAGLNESFESLIHVGHTASEMVGFLNDAVESLGDQVQARSVIISGGLKNFLDGYYLMSKSKLPALYGQAASFLKYALKGQEELDEYTQSQIQGLMLAKAFLKVK